MTAWAYCLLVGVVASGPGSDRIPLRAQMENALRPDRSAPFAGTISFRKEYWLPPGPLRATELYATQQWSTTTDGDGRLRVEVSISPPDSAKLSGGNDYVLGQTPRASWMYVVGSRELLVVPTEARAAALAQDARVGLMCDLLKTAQAQIERITLTSLHASSVEILLTEPDENQPAAVARLDERTARLTFGHVQEQLVVSSLATEELGVFDRSTYTDYRQINGVWLPGTIDCTHRDENSNAKSHRTRYSMIAIEPGDFDETSTARAQFEVLGQDGSLGKQVAIVTTFDDDGTPRHQDYLEWSTR